MRWVIGLAVVASGFAGTPEVDAKSGAGTDARILDRTARGDVFPIVQARFPKGVVAVPRVEFENLVGFRPVQMDLYTHADHRTHPAVVWIHGGGWSRGDARTSANYANWPAVLAELAGRGFVVASVEYRLSGEARFPAQVQDIKAAIRFLRTNARRYDIDPDRIILWGGSAGGHLAAMAATTCGMAAFEPEPSTGRLERNEMEALRSAAATPASDCAAAVALWYPLVDLSMPGSKIITDLLGCDPARCPEMASEASPITYAGAGDPPTLIIHGLSDRQAPVAAAQAFAAKLGQAGVPVEQLYLPGVDHGWSASTHSETVAAHRAALIRTFAFFDRVAKLPAR